jgi:hypothetical protein
MMAALFPLLFLGIPRSKLLLFNNGKSFGYSAGGLGLEWENLDYHLDLEGMLAGKKEIVRRSHVEA